MIFALIKKKNKEKILGFQPSPSSDPFNFVNLESLNLPASVSLSYLDFIVTINLNEVM